ncbi:MAG TPA: hypothetical protein VFP36_05745 [Usitatibacter sp.]|nr:hypothetical protein [Usitatibacter sp.]
MKSLLKEGIASCALAAAVTAFAQESPLGSPAGAAERYSADYASLVRTAMPRIDAAGLERLMENVRQSPARGIGLRDAQDAAKLLNLRTRGGKGDAREVDAGDAIVRYDPAAGHLRVIWRPSDTPAATRDRFKPLIPEIRRSHDALAARLGIEKRDVLFVDFREVLSQSDGRAQDGPRLPIVSEGATSTYLRAVAGVLVEGSFARINSIDAKQLGGVDVRWSSVKLAEEARAGGLRGPQDVLAEIVKHVEGGAKGMPVNVRMAVVLRPVDRAKPGLYVPSLKIGVKPQSVKTEDGYRTDAGEVFYSDLLKGAPPIVARDAHDREQSPGG